MGYIRAEDVLPSEVLALVQKYVEGQMLYVPKKDFHRSGWGSLSGARSSLKCRNDKIYEEYKAGSDVQRLAEKYFLSVKSIQKIIRDQRPSEESDRKEKQEG